jgi:hypothetical protein
MQRWGVNEPESKFQVEYCLLLYTVLFLTLISQ